MSWELEWDDAAIDGLRNLHWRTAARLDEAMMRFAYMGVGEPHPVHPPKPNIFSFESMARSPYF